MKKICVIAEEDLSTSRQKRLLDLLYGKFVLTGIGLEAVPYKDIEILSYPHAIKRNAEQEAELERNVAKKDYMKLVKIQNRMVIEKYLQERSFDAIFCKDLVLLPFVIENKKNAKVIVDCREYYPRQQSDERWKRLFAGFNDWLCQTYLPQADYVYSVCQGIAEEYTKNYGIKCDVITSAAYYFAPPPTLFAHSKETEQIKLIYHGMASPERGIEVMIETMDYVDSRFHLDLMLVPNHQHEYFDKLQAMTQTRKNVRIIPPVSFEEIIPFTSQYDIGFYILKPANFNHLYALPNKIFEFIQARLMIAISPNPEMARLVKQYNLGIIAKDFSPQEVAKSLSSLSKEQILQYKENVNKTAKILNAEKEGEKLLNIIEEVLE